MPQTTARLIGQMFWRQRRDTSLCAAFWSLHQVCEALVPVAIGLVIDQAVGTGSTSAMAWSVLGIFALFTALTMGWRSGFWFLSKAVVEESHELRMRVVRRVVGGRGIRTNRQSGELLSIATSDTQSAAELLELGSRGVSAFVGLTVSTVVLLRIDWSLGLGLVVGVPILVLGLNALGPIVGRHTSAQQQAIGRAAATASDLLRGLRPLRGFGGVDEAARRYRAASRTSLRASVGTVKAGATFVGASTFTTGLLITVVAALAGWYALQGRITVGQLITIVGLATFITDPVLNLADCVFRLATARASAARVAEVLAAPERAASGVRTAEPGMLALDEVHAPGLDGVGFAVRPGEMLGVVTGESDTADDVTDLLAGARSPERGEVTLAGMPLPELDVASLRRAVLVEPHGVDLLGATLREVLQTGDDRDDAALSASMTAASLGDLLADGDAGLDRELTDHGLNLSGGQRQRLALARALLADRPVTVFRDPTTAVDAVTEQAIADGIRAYRAGHGHATVLVTTSAPLLDRCDRVIFVRAGRVAATGRHRDLLAQPAYAEVVRR
ncbi:putative ABC transport system ATP-binding protein [Micromonospora phaseoli]|uniref:Putative ABC transport system ATP-binding protein n=1 Tax=Micromonospora phaseoli TaxID=1144548 RepID=A0A1H6UVK2_9ACTN|nr:ABC transporter ATP-binding protein [Micromonospora phaseoli]PZV93832.1 putative ABC transport system ATP-binding protein [Micromonospora phaseoli]GIJ80724.1 ABC transporter permease [Micromonospora phaseoli]SEI96271.1 putative ABC transport system ATP-binding protein [Micromonospora phaseoli]